MVVATRIVSDYENASVSTLLQALRSFSPKHDIQIDFQDYIVRTARHADEVEMALRLRYEVFFQELELLAIEDPIDVDCFDIVADHLLLIERSSGRIVGTYRFLCSEFTTRFYSQTEFDISRILALDGIKLELGRACVHRKHRHGMAIQMLWKGLTQYFKACGAKYMFGCSSIEGHLESEFLSIHQWLVGHYLSGEETRVFPKQDLPPWIELPALDQIQAEPNRKAEKLVPGLLKAYLHAGSKICGMPFWDSVFNTLDYFTLFCADDIDDQFGRKFGINK